jgi:hypothetical protein
MHSETADIINDVQVATQVFIHFMKTMLVISVPSGFAAAKGTRFLNQNYPVKNRRPLQWFFFNIPQGCLSSPSSSGNLHLIGNRSLDGSISLRCLHFIFPPRLRLLPFVKAFTNERRQVDLRNCLGNISHYKN